MHTTPLTRIVLAYQLANEILLQRPGIRPEHVFDLLDLKRALERGDEDEIERQELEDQKRRNEHVNDRNGDWFARAAALW
jgi:hypothetical protein